MVEDSVLLDMLKKYLEIGLEEGARKKSIMTVIETAGGVASPGPSGSLQCDLYRLLRLPAILVGDGQLGGISAYETLELRGYDVVAVVLENNGLVNEVPLSTYLRNRCRNTTCSCNNLMRVQVGGHKDQIRLYRWLQIELARDMGYAAARYGHVMFPENIYEPALECAELLLEGVGKGWVSRAFFSDNGSTAIEIALKMAFRKFLFDHGILLDLSKGEIAEKCIELKVLALCGSYHGDTLGTMEAQAPSSYTGLLQQPWHDHHHL